MTDYTVIPDGSLAPKAPITSEIGFGLRDNPVAIAEGAVNAPINQAFWHPYNATEVGDGEDGVFYDHSVDGDKSSVETPTFEDGYEYRLIGSNISHDGSPDNYAPVFDLYRETSAGWSEVVEGGDFAPAGSCDFDLFIHCPRLVENSHLVSGVQRDSGGATSLIGGMYSGTAQKISKARIYFRKPATVVYSDIDAGKLRLLRRRIIL